VKTVSLNIYCVMLAFIVTTRLC